MKFGSSNTSGGTPQSSNGRRYSNSGWVTPGVLALVSVGLIVAAFQHGHGNLHKLSKVVGTDTDAPTLDLGPGNQSPLRLTRSSADIGKNVEFLSATLLPGRGMNVFQITAMVPGHGEVPLLVSPPLVSANSVLSGTGEDANGQASTSLGGALLLPWADTLSGDRTESQNTIQTSWQGKSITVPAQNGNGNSSIEGLFLTRTSSSVRSDVIPDGQYGEAVFHAGNFAGQWPSSVDVVVRAELTAHALELTLTAKNIGNEPTPMGMGWHPFFAIPSGDRPNALLTIPSSTVYEVNHRNGLPTGKTVSTDGTALNLSASHGTKLGSLDINETYTNLQTGLLSAQPIAELRDPAYNLSLRVIPLTSNIRNLRVIAPADKSWVSIGPNTNAPDPFGSEWQHPQDAGMVTLAPGESMQWKVRIEIGPLAASDMYTR
jgi:aldose 1-epimerase